MGNLDRSLVVLGGSAYLSPDERKRLVKAEALAKSERASDRYQARALMAEVETEVSERIETRSVARGLDESVKLEMARGGEIDHSASFGHCRMLDRDGLKTLFDRARLTREEYDTGRVYRHLTEMAFSGGKSQMEPRVGGTTVDLIGQGFTRAKAGTLRTKIDLAVAVQLKSDPVALQVLRLVAGEGRALRTLANGSRSFDRHVVSLKSALAVAAKVLN